MVTKNFISAISQTLTSASCKSNFIDTTGTVISDVSSKWLLKIFASLTNEECNVYNYTTTGIPTYDGSDSGIALLLGSGATAPSSADYNMEEIITDYTVSSQSAYAPARNKTYDDVLVSVTRVAKNETPKDFTVSELGCFVCITQLTNSILIAREVLDTPITIASGESYSFTMTIGL